MKEEIKGLLHDFCKKVAEFQNYNLPLVGMIPGNRPAQTKHKCGFTDEQKVILLSMANKILTITGHENIPIWTDMTDICDRLKSATE